MSWGYWPGDRAAACASSNFHARKLCSQTSATVPGQVSTELSRVLEAAEVLCIGGGLWVRVSLIMCEITHIILVPSKREASPGNFRFTSHQGFTKQMLKEKTRQKNSIFFQKCSKEVLSITGEERELGAWRGRFKQQC